MSDHEAQLWWKDTNQGFYTIKDPIQEMLELINTPEQACCPGDKQLHHTDQCYKTENELSKKLI